MENKDLIISLIKEDLRHNQLVLNLNEMGLDSGGNYDLSLLATIANLMGIPTGKVSDQFGDVYESFMRESIKHPVDSNPISFSEMAMRCFNKLVACKDIEDRRMGLFPQSS